ncbi:MAG: DUF748 domain-containing protein [Thermodesulfobacteriota bacterium]
MKKFLKVTLIIGGILILLWIGLNILIKSYLTEEKLKVFILPKAKSFTGRNVELDRIHVSPFNGIVAKGLRLKERDGERDFIRLDSLILYLRLFPLLRKELAIKKIEIQSPMVTIRKERGGFNFNDIIERSSPVTSFSTRKKAYSFPLAIISEKVVIRNAHLSFIDEEKEFPNATLNFDAEVSGSIGRDGTPQGISGSISLKDLNTLLMDQTLKFSGKIEGDSKAIHANLKGQIEKDKVNIVAKVKDYLSSPEVIAHIHAKSLNLNPFLALTQKKKSSEEISKRISSRKESPFEKRFTEGLRASGEIRIDSAKYQYFTIKNFLMNYQYANGEIKLVPLELYFSSSGSLRTEGSLKGDLWFLYHDPMKTLKGHATVPLGKGSFQRSRLLDVISSITGVSSIKNLGFDQGLFNLEIKEQKIFLDGWISSALFKMSPKGTVDLSQRLDLNVDLRLSPELSKNLDRRLTFLRLLEDEKGWKSIPLKVKGTLDNPSVILFLTEGTLGIGLKKSLKKGLERFLVPSRP